MKGNQVLTIIDNSYSSQLGSINRVSGINGYGCSERETLGRTGQAWLMEWKEAELNSSLFVEETDCVCPFNTHPNYPTVPSPSDCSVGDAFAKLCYTYTWQVQILDT